MNRLGDDPPSGVDDRDAIARGARDEDPVVLGMEGDLVRVLADGNPGDGSEAIRFEDADDPAGPVGNKQLRTATRQGDVIRPRAGRRGIPLLATDQVECGDPAAIHIQ